jgi:probable F420-dependent oxidoreductase
MKFGAYLYGLEPSALRQVAVQAENLGYESLWRGDHLVIPVEYTSALKLSAGTPIGHTTPLYDLVALFGYLAASTKTIRLATGVLVLPVRDPFNTARAIMTLDRLSGGRVIAGVGAGWIKEESQAVGLDFSSRIARMIEGIEVMKLLWTEPTPKYSGNHYRFDAVGFEPKPIQQPHPPIVIGGESRISLSAAARHGDGWFGHFQPWSALEEKLDGLLRLRREFNRMELPFEVSLMAPVNLSVSDLHRLAESGVDRVVIAFGNMNQTDATAILPDLERVADRLL